MTSALELIEHVPVAAYAFRFKNDDFLLERVSAVVRKRNPELMEFYGRPMVGLYSDQPHVVEAARRCIQMQEVTKIELPVRRHNRNEATQFLQLTFVPVPPVHIILFMQDVANAEVAKTAQNESEARYQSLMASLPDGVMLRGADGRILFCNEVALKLFGAESEASLLGNVDALKPGYQVQTESGELVEPANDPSRQVLATGQPGPGQVLALVGGGQLRWVRVAAQPIRSAQGVLTGSVTTYSDITERVTAQSALRESAARLDLALSAARMGVWEFDPKSDVGWWSPNLDSIFSLSGRTRGLGGFVSHVHPDDRPAMLANAEKLIQGGDGDSFEQEYRIVGEDQVTRWARIRGRLSCASAHRVLNGTVVDVTEQHQLEEQLRRASRIESIGRLAGGVAHDFNNLLAAMLGSVELVAEHCPEAAQRDLETIRHSALRARDLTRQLLAFARKQPVEWKTVDLAALVRKIELMLRRLVGASIEIRIKIVSPVLVQADPSLLEQVLVNLVVNAGDAMPNGGLLEIRVARETATNATDDAAVLEVSDSGVGMDEDTRKQAFDPFFTTKSHGTGLGLASSYGIIQQHRGDICIDSRPGHGTRFRVTLPALDATRCATETPAKAPSIRPSSGTILVVDDEDIVRDTAVRMARSLGYDVVAAASGAEAIECISTHPDGIQLLLCDIAMPGEDGPSVAARLRLQSPSLKVLFMSGYLSDMQDVQLAGASFLQKPFSRVELAAKLAELQRS